MKKFEQVLNSMSEQYSRQLASCPYANLNEYFKTVYNDEGFLAMLVQSEANLPLDVEAAVSQAFEEYYPSSKDPSFTVIELSLRSNTPN